MVGATPRWRSRWASTKSRDGSERPPCFRVVGQILAAGDRFRPRKPPLIAIGSQEWPVLTVEVMASCMFWIGCLYPAGYAGDYLAKPIWALRLGDLPAHAARACTFRLSQMQPLGDFEVWVCFLVRNQSTLERILNSDSWVNALRRMSAAHLILTYVSS